MVLTKNTMLESKPQKVFTSMSVLVINLGHDLDNGKVSLRTIGTAWAVAETL